MNLFDAESHPVMAGLRELNPAALTPDQALEELTRLKSHATP